MQLSTAARLLRQACRGPVPTWALSRGFASGVEGSGTLCCLKDSRAVVKIKGEDTLTFLQGLVSNDVMQFANAGGPGMLYSLMLNNHGRFMFDLFLHKWQADGDNSLTVDVDKDHMPKFMRLLQMYKLRSNVSFLNISDTHTVWAHIGSKETGEPDPWFPDPRLPQLGSRAVLPAEFLPSGGVASPSEFQSLRFALGVPEGCTEIPSGEALPLEYNLDALNGVSYHKGCYVGQELTARTHFTGVIRKRLMPVEISGSGPSPAVGGAITAAGAKRAAGKLVAVDGYRGLAVLRLDAAAAAMQHVTELSCQGFTVTPSTPAWWPQEWTAPPSEENW